MEWTLALPAAERLTAVDTVLAVAAVDPATAVRIAERFCAGRLEDAMSCRDLLVRALDEHAGYAVAIKFALNGPVEGRDRWLNTAFCDWAAVDPERALAALAGVENEPGRVAAFAGVVTGWALADPEGLARYASTLASGPERDTAITQALTRWANASPSDALAWIAQQQSDLGCDAGLSTIASRPDLVQTRPDIAVQCAAGIGDPELRRSVLRTLGQTWAEANAAAAAQFVASATGLTSADRAALVEGVAAMAQGAALRSP
jgi:hypothetical protein